MNLIEYIEKESGMNCPEWLRETIERYFEEQTEALPCICSEIPNNSDLIERQAAIDAFHTWFADGFEEDRWWNSTHVLAAIEGLPSAQPEIVRCGECKWADWYTTIEGKQYCFCMETDNGGRTEEDFCSRGEREENG